MNIKQIGINPKTNLSIESKIIYSRAGDYSVHLEKNYNTHLHGTKINEI